MRPFYENLPFICIFIAIMTAAIVTIVYGAARALRTPHLKRRLAFSTVSNLSYILFSLTLMLPVGLTGALTHMVYHAVVKITMGLSFFLWAQTSFDQQQFGVCGKTILSLRRNVLQEIVPVLRELGMKCTEKRSENLLVVRSGKRRNRFWLFGGKDESSAALIQGSTFAGVLLDEAALMPRSFVEQACARCSVAGSKLWLDCNPEGPQHWFYREWICKAREKRALYLHFTMTKISSWKRVCTVRRAAAFLRP